MTHSDQDLGRSDRVEDEELAECARRAVSDNVRHSWDSLYWLLSEWHPDATDEQIEAAVKSAL